MSDLKKGDELACSLRLFGCGRRETNIRLLYLEEEKWWHQRESQTKESISVNQGPKLKTKI